MLKFDVRKKHCRKVICNRIFYVISGIGIMFFLSGLLVKNILWLGIGITLIIPAVIMALCDDREYCKQYLESVTPTVYKCRK